MKYLIVEDAKNTSDDLFKIIKSKGIDSKIEQAYNLHEAIQFLNNFSYDILVLDIQLPDGTIFDLLDVLKKQNKINFEIIFITGTDNRSLIMKAIKFSAVDFLAKPYGKQDVIDAIQSAEETCVKKATNPLRGLDASQLELLVENLKSIEKSKRIALRKIGGLIVYIELKDVVYVRADREICSFHFVENQVINASKHMGFYKDGLLSEGNFIQVHHNCILNLDYVTSLDPQEKIIHLINGETILASRRRFKELVERIGV